MSLAIIGDIHLSKRTWTKKQDIVDDASVSLQWITNYCIEHRLDALFLGDQFDTNYPPVEMVQVWYSCMDRLDKAGLSIFTIDGNHDPGQQKTETSEARSWTKVHPSVKHIDNKCFTYGTKKLAGYDFRPLSQVQEVIDRINEDKPDIVFMHQFPKQYGFENLDNVWDIDLDLIEHPCDVFCGHIHDPKVAQLNNGGCLYVVGSTNPRSISEIDGKVFYVLNSETGSLEKKTYPARKVRRFNFIQDSEEAIAAELDKLRQFADEPFEFADPILDPVKKGLAAITYDGKDVSTFTQVESICVTKLHTFYQPRFKKAVKLQDVESESVTLKQILSDTIKEDERVKRLSLRLLESPADLDDAVDSFINELQGEENDDSAEEYSNA